VFDELPAASKVCVMIRPSKSLGDVTHDKTVPHAGWPVKNTVTPLAHDGMFLGQRLLQKYQ